MSSAPTLGLPTVPQEFEARGCTRCGIKRIPLGDHRLTCSHCRDSRAKERKRAAQRAAAQNAGLLTDRNKEGEVTKKEKLEKISGKRKAAHIEHDKLEGDAAQKKKRFKRIFDGIQRNSVIPSTTTTIAIVSYSCPLAYSHFITSSYRNRGMASMGNSRRPLISINSSKPSPLPNFFNFSDTIQSSLFRQLTT
jgi:hypothetical protein